ncbi:MAG TPA: hypothetical protein VME43_26585 [Bryobacteraceae bacterium]|nr:hypothetical protein [Bryobacteraceae bacterium]
MRRRFNTGKYWERLRAGELEEHSIVYHPNTRYPEVILRHPGAVSVTSRYRVRATGRDVAEVHFFRPPDGSVIPNKRPDPKLLFEDGVWYHLEKAKNREKRLAEEARQPVWKRILRRVRRMIESFSVALGADSFSPLPAVADPMSRQPAPPETAVPASAGAYLFSSFW